MTPNELYEMFERCKDASTENVEITRQPEVFVINFLKDYSDSFYLICGANESEIKLDVNIERLAENITFDDVEKLVYCGVCMRLYGVFKNVNQYRLCFTV